MRDLYYLLNLFVKTNLIYFSLFRFAYTWKVCNFAVVKQQQ